MATYTVKANDSYSGIQTWFCNSPNNIGVDASRIQRDHPTLYKSLEITYSRPPFPYCRPPYLNINTASAKDLTLLPGIGDVKARAIVDHRDEHGSFKKTEHLTIVSGIGDKTYAQLESFVGVSGKSKLT